MSLPSRLGIIKIKFLRKMRNFWDMQYLLKKVYGIFLYGFPIRTITDRNQWNLDIRNNGVLWG